MNRVFADTSGLYAFLVANDSRHEEAVRAVTTLARDDVVLVTTSYVAHECVSLLHSRMGLTAVRSWRDRAEPLLDTIWIDATLHERGLAALVAAGRRRVSFTDWTSFEAMRLHGLERAFAFDADFRREGFETVP